MRQRYRGFFWPAVLIVIGIFALLVDLNVISADRLYRLADLWPLILIVLGLELIARRTLQGAAVDIAAVLIMVVGDTSMGPDLYRAVLTYSGPKPEVTLDEETGEVRISQQGEFGIFGSRH